MTNKNSTQAIESLAAAMGKNAYIDVAKWHLYLSDAHLHIKLAEEIYPLLLKGMPSTSEIEEILQRITVKLGGGKRELPLADLMPAASQQQLIESIEDYQREM